MRALLLAAGQSKRFWPLSEKPLLEVCGKPLILHIAEELRGAGIDQLTIVVSPGNRDSLASLFPQDSLVTQEQLELGMQGALLSALPTLKGDEPILVVGSNDLLPTSLYRATVAALNDATVDGAILCTKPASYFPGGYVVVHAQGHIQTIVEKPEKGNEPSDTVAIACYAHRSPRALLAALQGITSKRDDGHERALAKLMEERRYVPVLAEGAWQAIKYPWHLLSALPLLLTQITPRIDPSASIHASAVIDGPVVIGKNVRVLPGACIRGPCTIDDECVIGNGVLVRGSSLGKRCVIGYGSEVKSCILGNDVWTHTTYLGDSVIGENVSFGAGCITGNYRLDELPVLSTVENIPLDTSLLKFGTIIGRDCRFGIRVGTNPGVKIGPGTFVSGGVMISSDIPSKSFVKVEKGEMIIKENRSTVPGSAQREGFKKAARGG